MGASKMFYPIAKKMIIKKGRVALPNRMNFWKSAKGGGLGHFQLKIYVADFGSFKQGFLIIKLQLISGFMICFFDNCIEKIKT